MTQVNHSWQLHTRTGWRGPTGLTSEIQDPITVVSNNSSVIPSRRRYVRLLIVTDSSIIVSVAITTAMLNVGINLTAASNAVLIAAVWLIALSLFKTRANYRIGAGAEEYKRVALATAVSIGCSAFVAMLVPLEPTRIMILIVYPCGLALLLIERLYWRNWLRRQDSGISNVVVFGHGSENEHVLRQLRNHAGLAYNVVGVVEETNEKENPGFGQKTSEDIQDLDSFARSVEADTVIVSSDLEGGNHRLQELIWCLEESNIQVVVVPACSNVSGRRMKVRSLGGLTMVHIDTPRFSKGANLAKRIMDISISAIALLVLLPIFAILSILIRRDSPGPVLFSQERVGLNGVTFRMHKFRSMIVNAEEELQRLRGSNEGSGPLFKMRQDPRITKVGAWMRKFSLDELPQLLNVFRGEMSLVGPRPPLPVEVATYEHGAHRRLYIRPGLTGLWQVSGRSNLDWDESIRLDLHYVENWSLGWDLLIVWKTFKVVIFPVGAY